MLGGEQMGAARVIVAVAWLGLALPAGAHAAQPCHKPSHARLMARDPQLLAWQKIGPGTGYPGTVTSVVTLCRPPHGHRHQVFNSSGDGAFVGVKDVQSAGPVIGFSAEDADQYTEDQELLVFDAAGHELLDEDVESFPIDAQAPSPGFGGYVLDAGGDVAWVETDGAGLPGATAYLLLRTDAGHSQIASAATITNLAITNGTLSWEADGVAASMTLPATG
jgi:hypothetical protein